MRGSNYSSFTGTIFPVRKYTCPSRVIYASIPICTVNTLSLTSFICWQSIRRLPSLEPKIALRSSLNFFPSIVPDSRHFWTDVAISSLFTLSFTSGVPYAYCGCGPGPCASFAFHPANEIAATVPVSNKLSFILNDIL